MRLLRLLLIVSLLTLGVAVIGFFVGRGALSYLRHPERSASPLVRLWREGSPDVWADVDSEPVFSHGLQSREWFEEQMQTRPAFDRSTCVDTRSVVFPHHLVVLPQMSAQMDRVSDRCHSFATQTVVVLSPNHFGTGKGAAQTINGRYTTPFGDLFIDHKKVAELVDRAGVPLVPETFVNEHGVAALTPLIRTFFPEAKLVPIVVSGAITDVEAQALAAVIHGWGDRVTVVTSADFSHEVPAYLSGFHDDLTESWMSQSGVPSLAPAVDAVGALRVAFAFNALSEAQVWTRLFRDISPPNEAFETENVTHLIGAFTSGRALSDPFVSLMVVGDIMLDRGVRKRIESEGVESPWLRVGRLLSGVHLRVANLEGTIGEEPAVHTPHDPPYDFVFDPKAARRLVKHLDIVSLANNHTRDFGERGERETRAFLDEWGIPWFGSWSTPVPVYETEVDGFPLTFIGYHQFFPALDALDAVLDDAQKRGRFAIVYPHWGEEYRETPDVNQRALARRMIDHGADLIIGGHPHVPQAWEVMDGVPVVWSLGNFIFDQRIPETWRALTVGVRIDANEIELAFMPISARDAQPALLTDTAAKHLIDELQKRTETPLTTTSDSTFRLVVPHQAFLLN